MAFIERLRALSPLRQGLLAVVVALIFAGVLAVIYVTVLRQPYAPLFTNLRTNEAGLIVAELEKRKVPFRLEDHGGTILVPAEMVDRTRLGVANDELPMKGGVGFELFNKSDMGLTEFAQKINYQRALQGELARTIMTMDGVDTARVHLSIPEPALFRDDRKPPKASVTMAMRPGRLLNPATVGGVQKLVAAAVSDLSADDVVVLDQAGAVVSGASAMASAAALEPEFNQAPNEAPGLQAKRSIEAYYLALAREALQSRTAGADARVSVTAELPPGLSLAQARGWNPAKRDFPLTVSLQAPYATASVRAELERALVDVLDLKSERGDKLTSEDLAVGQINGSTTASAPHFTIGQTKLSPATWTWVGGLALIALLAGAMMFDRRRGAVASMTADQRRAFAEKLKTLLERTDDDLSAAA